MVSLAVTHRSLVLGASDATTGIPALGYTDSTINIYMEPASVQQIFLASGKAVALKYKGWTGEALGEGDLIVDSFSVSYIVLSCVPRQVGNIIDHYESELGVISPVEALGGGVGSGTWILHIIAAPVGYGTTSPSGVAVIAAGSTVQVTATATYATGFNCWVFDGVAVGSANPYTVAAQASGSTHYLVAVFNAFTPALGVGAPVELFVECIADTEILSPSVASIEGIVDTEILAPSEAAIATAVSVTVGVARWFIDCAYSATGALNPTGLQVVASGATLAVTSTSDTANGYVQASATPFSLDDATFHHGTVDAAGTGSYTVPAQTDNTWHQLKGSFSVGWGSFGTTCTPTGYSYNVSAATRTYTAVGDAGAGNHWHIWLDGATDLGHSPAVVPAQADGSYHAVTQVATPD